MNHTERWSHHGAYGKSRKGSPKVCKSTLSHVKTPHVKVGYERRLMKGGEKPAGQSRAESINAMHKR